MKFAALASDLRQKALRALISARELQDRDPDGSVNRSYYAMFDIARAALLSAGLREDELPRTHSGVIAAFSKHAVQSGQIDQKLSAALSRTESLRLMADYTGKSLDAKTAVDAAARAEAFVSTVEKAFALGEASSSDNLKDDGSDQEHKVSELSAAIEKGNYEPLKPISIAEIQREARENWLKLHRQNIEAAERRGAAKDTERRIDEDKGHSAASDLDE